MLVYSSNIQRIIISNMIRMNIVKHEININYLESDSQDSIKFF